MPLKPAFRHEHLALSREQAGNALIVREPVGVVGAIIPWNFPLTLLANKLGPALVAGNTVVAKPAETTPLTTLRVAQLLAEAGIPAGVVNIVTGAAVTLARTLAEHDGVDAMWFFGSRDASAMVEKASVGNLKQTWTSKGLVFDLFEKERFEGDYWLAKATQVKNVWAPYGE
jgi:aldehyde dehydrogenase (NAD+)